MRFWILIALFEAGLLGLVVAISHTRIRSEPRQVAAVPLGNVRPALGTTLRHEEEAFATAFRSALNGLERRLSAEEKAAGLEHELTDAIMRMEGLYDPTRVGLFGTAMRMQVRPGNASMGDVFGERWTRVSADPNLHRHVTYIAESWLRPRSGGCDDFWMFRRSELAVMLDGLTPDECRRLRAGSRTVDAPAAAPVVAARLRLPAFAAPYPGNRVSIGELRSEQAAHIEAVLQNRWFHRRDLSRTFGISRR